MSGGGTEKTRRAVESFTATRDKSARDNGRRMLDLSGIAAAHGDRAALNRRQVEGFLDALDADRFHLEFAPRTRQARGGRQEADTDTVIAQWRTLARRNAQGTDIFARFTADADGRVPPVAMVDDLDEAGVQRLAADYPVAAAVETSFNRFQAWLKLSEAPIARERLGAMRRHLAERYGGDMGAAQAPDQAGRLPGFTNRKPEHIRGGQLPFATLRHAGGASLDTAARARLEARGAFHEARVAADATDIGEVFQQAAQRLLRDGYEVDEVVDAMRVGGLALAEHGRIAKGFAQAVTEKALQAIQPPAFEVGEVPASASAPASRGAPSRHGGVTAEGDTQHTERAGFPGGLVLDDEISPEDVFQSKRDAAARHTVDESARDFRAARDMARDGYEADAIAAAMAAISPDLRRRGHAPRQYAFRTAETAVASLQAADTGASEAAQAPAWPVVTLPAEALDGIHAVQPETGLRYVEEGPPPTSPGPTM